MAETRKTTALLNRGDSMFLGVYLARDAAMNTRNRRYADGNTITREQRTELGHILLRLGLAHSTGTAPDDWQIGRSAAGGPVVLQSQVPLKDLHLGLSHSGDFLVAGICNAAPIGIDIERYRKRRFTEIAQHLDWPQVTWDPPGLLQADGFYHLWTLWEAAIKSCSTKPGVLAESVFKRIIPELAVGTPNAARTQESFARSWQCPGDFWLSVIAGYPDVRDIRLFVVNGLKSAHQTPQISEIANDNGLLDPDIFGQEQSEMI